MSVPEDEIDLLVPSTMTEEASILVDYVLQHSQAESDITLQLQFDILNPCNYLLYYDSDTASWIESDGSGFEFEIGIFWSSRTSSFTTLTIPGIIQKPHHVGTQTDVCESMQVA